MDVKVVQRPLFSTWMDTNTIGRTQHRSLQLPWKSRNLERPEVLISVHSNPRRTSGYQTDCCGGVLFLQEFSYFGLQLNNLSSLFKERGEAYANANAWVSLEEIAAKHGYRDVSFVTPAAIAIEALKQMECYLEDVEEIPFSTL